MIGFSRFNILGRCSKPPAIKTSRDGNTYIILYLSVENYSKSSGETKKFNNFFNIFLYGKLGENISKFNLRDELIYCEGNICVKQNEGNDSTKSYDTIFMGTRVEVLSSNKRKENNNYNQLEDELNF